MPVNLRDMLLKLFWTVVVTVAGFVVVYLADPSSGKAWWTAGAIAVAQLVLSFARQKTGAVPPVLEVAKDVGVAPTKANPVLPTAPTTGPVGPPP